MGLTGQISLNFKAPMFINPKYYRKPEAAANRSLLAENITEFTTLSQSPVYPWCNTTDGTKNNKTWVIC